MNDFIYSYPTKVYFGQGATKKALTAELWKFGKTIMIAYGGGSVKRNGIFDEICGLRPCIYNVVADEAGALWCI